ncbi:glycosyltransferase [Bacillus sp. 165]|uniref:glycosyltransferase n=1 Tax=Bacillus sp. 165 TaxID=1529117 RepID=UPI001ADBCFDD|nr:glycosyltransferase [Bacillus sp. 165]MBO9130018.1 hypothetical protein [Bacillus sp. 165]
MKTIAYYISDYGYGHASRSIALIRELLKRDEDVQIIICHSFALSFLQDSLKEYNSSIIYHKVKTDVGYVLKQHSLEVDTAALEKKCREYLDYLPFVAKEEAVFLEAHHVQLIVSDITPLAFEIGEILGVPSIGVSNFTWYTAYQGLVSEGVLSQLYDSYRKMTMFYALAGSSEPSWGEVHKFGFFSRTADSAEVKRIQTTLNPLGNKKLVFMPIGMKIDIGDLSDWDFWNQEGCVFIVSSNMDVSHPNVVKIPFDYTESQNYAAASDVMISKAGWGTVSEAVTNTKPLIVINRNVQEDQNTIEYLQENGLCKVVEWEEFHLLDIESVIRQYNKGYIQNEVSHIVECILHLITV